MTTSARKPAPPNVDLWDEFCPGIIMRWPGLSTEAKLSWAYLWSRAGRRPATLEISFPDIAWRLGRTEGRARSWVGKLTGAGLLDRIDGKRGPGGSVLVYIPDPARVARLRKIDHPDADQLGLFDDTEPGCDQTDNSVACASTSGGIIPAHVEADVKIAECGKPVVEKNSGQHVQEQTAKALPDPSNVIPSDVNDGTENANLRPKEVNTSSNLIPNSMVTLPRSAHPLSHAAELSKAERAAIAEIEWAKRNNPYQPPEPQQVGKAVLKYLENFSPEEIRKQRNKFKAELFDATANDEKFSPVVAEHIADLVQSGQIDRDVFARIINNTNRGVDGYGEKILCRRSYIIGAFKTLCKNRGLAWPFKKGK